MNTRSICSSCRHQNNCLFLLHAQGNIHQCEEFDLEPVTKVDFIHNDRIEECDDKHTGLCKNCKDRGYCHLHTDNTVIWHCEEFH